MQFIANGPNIPNELLQAHEECNVVFFCGAGISYSAGLPLFKGLVDQIYDKLNTSLDDHKLEKSAYESHFYDTTLHLLEQRLPGGRLKVRKALVEILSKVTSDEEQGKALANHFALIKLAQSKNKALKLVTTNFDLLFEDASKLLQNEFRYYSAPALPVPDMNWRGLVYLHGVIPKLESDNDLQYLVMSSGDFGRAYLTEGWATRFLVKLFQSYIVCFVGYSLNDPILRYMTDALLAEKMQGGEVLPSYAFIGYKDQQNEAQVAEWKNKGITYPIPYQELEHHDHSLLTGSLTKWAEIYTTGISGKKAIILKYATKKPTASTVEDNFIERVMWALMDKSGDPASYFANFNPVPPVEWIEEFAVKRFSERDLFSFHSKNEEHQFNFFELLNMQRTLSEYHNNSENPFTSVEESIHDWLIKHLNNPTLFFFLMKHKKLFPSSFFYKLKHVLSQINNPPQTAESPKQTISSSMQRLWNLFIVKIYGQDEYIPCIILSYTKELLNSEQNTNLYFNLCSIIKPFVIFRKAIYSKGILDINDATPLKDIVDVTFYIRNHSEIVEFFNNNSQVWGKIPNILNSIQLYLLEAFDILSLFEKAGVLYDYSYFILKSISKHEQNRYPGSLAPLIILLREGWLNLRERAPLQARLVAIKWFDLPYPIFKRLAFFAASQDKEDYLGNIGSEHWCTWLISDKAYWLWCPIVKREVMQLIRTQAKHLSLEQQNSIERVLLDGPPKDDYDKDLSEEDLQSRIANKSFLYLSKLLVSGLQLSDEAMNILTKENSLAQADKCGNGEQNEFAFWMTLGWEGAGIFKDEQIDAIIGKSAIKNWIVNYDTTRQLNSNYEGIVSYLCEKQLLELILATKELINENIPIDNYLIKQILGYSSEKDTIANKLVEVHELIILLNDEIIMQNQFEVSRWLKAVAGQDVLQAERLELCKRILILNSALKLDDNNAEDRPDYPNSAISHPVGYITEAIIDTWTKVELKDGGLLPDEIKEIFTDITKSTSSTLLYGKVILAINVNTLFKVDEEWIKTYLLKLFDWENNIEVAAAVWQGFLIHRSYNPSLLEILKSSLLETSRHIDKLGSYSKEYIEFITYLFLQKMDNFEYNDFPKEFSSSTENLEIIAEVMLAMLESSDNKFEYWENFIKPFWIAIWPMDKRFISVRLSSLFIEMSIISKDIFKDAYVLFEDWIIQLNIVSHILNLLSQSELCDIFPKEILGLLSKIINNKNSWDLYDLGNCLEKIAVAQPEIKQEEEFKALENLTKK